MAEKDVSFLSVCKSLLLPEQLVLCNRLACRVLVLDTNSSSDFAEFGVWRVKFQENQAKSFMSYMRVKIPYGFWLVKSRIIFFFFNSNLLHPNLFSQSVTLSCGYSLKESILKGLFWKWKSYSSALLVCVSKYFHVLFASRLLYCMICSRQTALLQTYSRWKKESDLIVTF